MTGKAGRHQNGFTLIEVLAAVAVLALAMSAVIVAATQYAANAAYLRDKTLATWVARNKLVELHLQPSWPGVGRKDGTEEMAGRKWPWRLEVSTTPDPSIRRVEVTVDSPERQAPLADLSGFLSPTPSTP